jgi:hypothetical protein
MCYVEWCDLGCKRVGLESFMVSIDYRDYMGSSSKIWAFQHLFLYLCSYNLVGSVTDHIGAVLTDRSVSTASSLVTLLALSRSPPPPVPAAAPSPNSRGQKNKLRWHDRRPGGAEDSGVAVAWQLGSSEVVEMKMKCWEASAAYHDH